MRAARKPAAIAAVRQSFHSSRASPDAGPQPNGPSRCRCDYQPSAPRSILSSLITPFFRSIRVIRVLCIRSPKLDLVLQLNPLLAAHAFTNLFRKGERVFRTRVLTFRDDEVRMLGRDDSTSASLSLHPHLVNDLARAHRARWWIFEETTCGPRAVRLRRESSTLSIVHARLDLFGIIRLQTQRRTQQKLAFAK